MVNHWNSVPLVKNPFEGNETDATAAGMRAISVVTMLVDELRAIKTSILIAWAKDINICLDVVTVHWPLLQTSLTTFSACSSRSQVFACGLLQCE